MEWILDSYINRKVDIEGYELDALPEWIESGALEKVFQFSGILYVWFPGKGIFESKGDSS